ncbi:MAG: hypothetical protein AABY18_07010 [Candidatus Thermoplasmatota archaeon]
MAVRPFLQVSLVSLGLALALGIAAPFAQGTAFAVHDLGQAHFVLGVFGFLLPGIAAMHLHGLAALHGRPAPEGKAKVAALAWGLGSATLALALAFADGLVRLTALALGLIVLTEAAILTMLLLLKLLPRRKQSVVDVARDPLTKGDDASLTQARFAQFFLVPAVVATVAAGPWWDWTHVAAPRVWLAGLHLLLAGHALVSCYSITHLWVPRLAKVPAIAAGAIKGELHSSLLGLVFLMVAFGLDSAGWAIAGGAFLFFGAFTWMGVLGANIMRNKSKTQRVTPEFTYIPWVFTGVFWLVCGVLLGVFLNAVPDAFADRLGALRFTHAHSVLLGGFVQIAIGLAMRIVPMARGVGPLPFHEGKWGFYALNLGLTLLVAGQLGSGVQGRLFQWGGLLALLGVAVAFMSLTRHDRRLRT